MDAMKVYVDVLKRELDEEFRIAERLDGKARGYLTAATVSVAAAQAAAVAFIVRVEGVPALLAALVAAVVLAWAGIAGHRVLTATRTHEIATFDIGYAKQLLPHAYHGDAVAVLNLTNVMIRVLEDRRRANEDRHAEVELALDAARLASRLVAIELAGLVLAFGVHIWLTG